MRVLPIANPWSSLGSALPDLALGVVYLVAWIAPGTFGTNVVPQLMLIMLLEFIIVHSSVFLGQAMFSSESRARRVKGVLGISAFYTLFILGFALAFKTWWPMLSFWGQTLNRLTGVLFGQAPDGNHRLFLQRTWAVTAMAYLCFAGLTTLLPVPRLGIIDAYREGIPGSGEWVDQPQRVIAFGFLYFTTVGISELFAHRWVREQDVRGTAGRPSPEARVSEHRRRA